MESQWEVQERRHSSSPAPKRRRKAKGRLLRREDHFEASVRLGRDIGDRARITLIQIARTHRVILGILLCVRTTKQNQAAASATCAFLRTERPMVSRTNVRRGVVERAAANAEAKGNQSALNGSKEFAISGRQKGKCTQGDACSFRYDFDKRGKSTRSSSPTPEQPTKNRWEVFFEKQAA